MKRYIDGFVVPVPKKRIKEYQKIAAKCGKVWLEHGALQYVEAVGEDMKKMPYCSNFTDLVKPKKGETVVVAYIMYKSRAHRDRVNKKVNADPRMQPGEGWENDMPFDCKRMAFNGFETLVCL